MTGALRLWVCGMLCWVGPAHAGETILVPTGATWSYLDTGVAPASDWSSVAFDDSTWATGPAKLGYGDGDEATTLSYGPDSNNKYITSWFRTTFSVSDPALYHTLKHRVLRDDGVVVYLNGVEQYRDNMPAGTIDSATLASSSVGGGEESTYYDFYLDVADLIAGDNVLAIEVHQRAVTSSDLGLDYELLGLDGPAVVTRGPYLNRNTPDSIVVKWRTSNPTDSVVEFGAAQGALTSSTTDATLTVDHEVEITGLTPDTLYHYAVGETGQRLVGDDGNHVFQTSPDVGSTGPHRFWFVGDSGTANDNQRAVRDAFGTWTGSQGPDLFLMLGDNAYNDGTDTEYQAALFDIYPETLRSVPVWSTLGNHDGYSADSATLTGPYYDIFTLPMNAEAGGVASGTEAYYSFDYGNVHFVCLDSYDSDRAVGGAMLTWLEADLSATTQDWVVAFWHHPPYTKGSHDSDTESRLVDMRANALPILESYGVDLVLSGHSHSYERSFQIDGHYDTSDTFDAAIHGVDMGSGAEAVDGAYLKPSTGLAPNEGAVYITAGSSGKISGGSLDHAAMHVSLNSLGSVVVDVDGDRMDVWFIDDGAAQLDAFTLLKGRTCQIGDDDDEDGVCNGTDNCAQLFNPAQANQDGDLLGDDCDPCPNDSTDDEDGDGVCEDLDACPGVADPDQADADSDGIGDACDPCTDVDVDGSCGFEDNCITSYNPGQEDADGDGIGDVCDTCPNDALNDLDGDGICADIDVCPFTSDPQQADLDADGLGDACDLCQDVDADGACDPSDTCPGVADPGQEDSDGDGTGDACDACPGDALNDVDGDGVCGDLDGCPLTPDPGQEDSDGDGLGDACDGCIDVDQDGACEPTDNCVGLSNPGQEDTDGDGLGDLCDPCPQDPLNDTDADGLCADVDGCPEVADPGQEDSDGDGIGDVCDACPDDSDNDADGDGLCAEVDNCPVDHNTSQLDSDGDGLGNVCDACPDDPYADSDGDGVCGDVDLCPTISDPDQADDDGDGLGDVCDACPQDPDNDIDGDGVCGDEDTCPDDSDPEQLDADLDGLGDLCDPCPQDVLDDVDGDGLCGEDDNCPEDHNASQIDTDGDGVGNACDPCPEAPEDDADGDGVCDNPVATTGDTDPPLDDAEAAASECGCSQGPQAPSLGWLALAGLIWRRR